MTEYLLNNLDRVYELIKIANSATRGPWSWSWEGILMSEDGEIVLWPANSLTPEPMPEKTTEWWAETLGVYEDDSESEVLFNAALIAAAPEMARLLAKLADTLHVLADLAMGGLYIGGSHHKQECLEQILQVIVGEQQARELLEENGLERPIPPK